MRPPSAFPRCLAALALCLAAGTCGAADFRRALERVPSLDPAQAASAGASRAVALCYETLLEYDYTARPYRLVPGLAAALPEVSSNGLIYTFRIDPAARFIADPCFGGDGRTGRPVNAMDLAFSLKRLADAKLASPGYWILDGRIAGLDAFRERSRGGSPTDYDEPVAGLTAPAPDSFRIELTQPCPPFLWMLALSYASAVPREAVAFYGAAFGDHPVGSGPYRLGQWRRNYRMVFERNPDWRGWSTGPAAAVAGRPFDRVVFPVIDDASTQWLAFLSGQLDLQGEISRDIWDAVADGAGRLRPFLRSRGILLFSMPTLEVEYLGINMNDPVLGPNKALRQALNCAFDAGRWERFHQARVSAADGPVPPGVAGRLETPPPWRFSLARAAELLAEAGYPQGRDPATGRRLRLVLDIGRTTQEIRESTELLVAFMAGAGIELEPAYHNWPAFLQKVSRRETQLFRVRWVGDYPDAENFLQLFYGPNASPGPNRCNYANPAFDELYRASLATTNPSERLSLYGRMQEMIRDDCPWVFMHYPRSYSLSHPHVLNYQPHDFPYGMEKYLREEADEAPAAPHPRAAARR